MVRRILIVVAGALAFCALLGFGLMEQGRQERTAHETTIPTPLTAEVADGLWAELTDCFVVAVEPTLTVRALSPTPRIVFTSTRNEETTLSLRMENVDRGCALISGATRKEDPEAPATLALEATVPAVGKAQVDIEPDVLKDTFTFYVWGDSHGHNDILEQMLAHAEEDHPLFTVGLGDTIRDSHDETAIGGALRKHARFMSHTGLAYFAAAGDAEVRDDTFDADARVKTLGPTYYRFAYGNSLFIVLDNACGYISQHQIEWLQNVLKKEGPDYKHIFAFGHEPIFDPRPGMNHCMKPYVGRAGQLKNVLEKSGVEAFFAGHIHEYLVTTRYGMRYVVSGGAGAAIKGHAPSNHFVKVAVDGEHVTVDAHWFDRGPDAKP